MSLNHLWKQLRHYFEFRSTGSMGFRLVFLTLVQYKGHLEKSSRTYKPLTHTTNLNVKVFADTTPLLENQSLSSIELHQLRQSI